MKRFILSCIVFVFSAAFLAGCHHGHGGGGHGDRDYGGHWGHHNR